MQAVAIAHAVGETADDQFGSCVRLADATHSRTDFGRRSGDSGHGGIVARSCQRVGPSRGFVGRCGGTGRDSGRLVRVQVAFWQGWVGGSWSSSRQGREPCGSANDLSGLLDSRLIWGERRGIHGRSTAGKALVLDAARALGDGDRLVFPMRSGRPIATSTFPRMLQYHEIAAVPPRLPVVVPGFGLRGNGSSA